MAQDISLINNTQPRITATTQPQISATDASQSVVANSSSTIQTSFHNNFQSPIQNPPPSSTSDTNSLDRPTLSPTAINDTLISNVAQSYPQTLSQSLANSSPQLSTQNFTDQFSSSIPTDNLEDFNSFSSSWPQAVQNSIQQFSDQQQVVSKMGKEVSISAATTIEPAELIDSADSLTDQSQEISPIDSANEITSPMVEQSNRGPEHSQDGSLEGDGGRGVSYVEQGPDAEISPELAAYIEQVRQEDNQQGPQEVIIADDQASLDNLPKRTVKQAVVVLPITKEIEKRGAHASIVSSIRWLVEWSRKMIKMFVGKVIYRES